MEEWRDIKGYEGKYMVSNLGRVKSLDYRHTGKERILKPCPIATGYLYVNLWKEGKVKHCRIHRLVAIAFISNPNNLPIINHKNEIKSDNRVSNLEWCSYSYNNNYNDKAKKVGKKNSKPVLGINKVSGLVVEFPSAREATKQMGIAYQNICHCLKGKRNSAGGFYWKYVD